MKGMRLDAALAQLCAGVSRSRLASLIRDGAVSIGGEAVTRPRELLAGGEAIEVHFPAPSDPPLPGPDDPFRLPLLYEDEHLIVIDKPAGLVSHPSPRFPTGSVACLADAHYGPLPQVQGEGRPGIVHRLDRMTSGVMLIGRTLEALEALKQGFRERRMHKTYVALVHGAPRFESDWLESRLAPTPGHPDRIRALREDPDDPAWQAAREASTYYEVRERFEGFALLECRPKTGRTHQIRVHLSSIGLPVVGDLIYRGSGRRARLQKDSLPAGAPEVTRHMLHAAALGFVHPVTGEEMRFEAPLPEEMERLVGWLRGR